MVGASYFNTHLPPVHFYCLPFVFVGQLLCFVMQMSRLMLRNILQSNKSICQLCLYYIYLSNVITNIIIHRL